MTAHSDRPPPPDNPDAAFLDILAAQVPLFGAALQAHRAGQLANARAGYLELLDQPALTATCLHQLGVLAGQMGDHGRAAELIGRAIRLEPNQPLFYDNLSVSLERWGSRAGAIDALVDLACAWQKVDRNDRAIPIYERILAADPCRYAACVNMGTAFAWLGDTRNAVVLLLRGVALHAMVMAELRPFLDAVLPRLVADRIVPADMAVPPGPPTGRVEMIEQALSTLGKALMELGYAPEALHSYRLAVEIEPGLGLAHWNLSLALLTEGDFERGWREYEWRWHWDKFPEPRRRLAAPEWRGEALAGKTILAYAEQGYGDAIQFAPLALRLKQQAADVLLEVTTPQVRLFRESFAEHGCAVIERSANPHYVQTERPFDYVVPLMSLPERLGLSFDELPIAERYLRPAPADAERWAERLAASPGRKVGLAWAGRPTHGDDRKRSVSLEQLRPFFAVDGITWHSLQVGPQAEEIAASGLRIANHAANLADFADTAAAIAALDLVITVDTAVAHLAAAIGKPTWILLPAVADWRWLRDRVDSPWYPTVRLFRQQAIGDWQSAIADLARALHEAA